jgi:DNA-binding PadR family transcriptional regulator
MESNVTIDNLILEMRRGAIVLATLSQLKEEQYGYSLMKSLADKDFVVEQSTLYPLLRRLEDQGMLVSDWRLEGARPRRYYKISPEGIKILKRLEAEWTHMVQTMEQMIGGKND